MTDEWEYFRDSGYYDMYAIRRKNNRDFQKVIHVQTEGEAVFITQALNERDMYRVKEREHEQTTTA